ncbi:hypothetical protein F4802DRAFT_562052 [Xylaria palmicola]|nr:hypothetical protein F4802DRAFT_562052 [Xylaria palmicola]
MADQHTLHQLEMDSKPRLLPAAPHWSHIRQEGQRRKHVVKFITLALFITSFALYRVCHWKGVVFSSRRHEDSREWEWSMIEPSRDVLWHSCYDDAFDCARLDLPMDWLDPFDDERVILAIIRLRATDRDDYRGPVIFNPGGPGESGVFALKDHGAHLQTIIGRNHDLLSFDPRGIGASVPRIECWDRPEQRRLWDLHDIGVIDAHPGTIYDVYARAAAFSHTCEAHMTSKSDILRHIGTASHARDMLEILHKLGQERLKYWGFSYGTILGGVFAAMYPDKVERLVSDGNVDLREWHYQTYINFPRDMDKVMGAFYHFCHQAGEGGCDFYAETPELIQERLDHLLETIRKHPVLIPAGELFSGTGPNIPQLVSWSDVRRLTSAALYRPVLLFKKYATALAALEAGDGLPLYNLNKNLYNSEGPAPSICSTEDITPDTPRLEAGNSEAFPAIMCSDLPSMNGTVEEFVEFAQRLLDISKSAGDVNALFRLACIGRTIRPKWRFDGPFEGNTSFPILYVNNIADNVAPLVSATNNSQGFPGSVILAQNSYGHTSLSAPSSCTASHIHRYFQLGELPKPGTTCEPDYYPFQDIDLKNEDELGIALNGLLRAGWSSTAKM